MQVLAWLHSTWGHGRCGCQPKSPSQSSLQPSTLPLAHKSGQQTADMLLKVAIATARECVSSSLDVHLETLLAGNVCAVPTQDPEVLQHSAWSAPAQRSLIF